MHPTEGPTFETVDPRTGALLATVPEHDADEVAATVARAAELAPRWAALDVAERVAHLMEVRDRLLDRADHLVDVICAETGKQRTEALTTEIMPVCEAMDWYRRNAGDILAPRPVGTGTLAHKRAWVRREALGVVGVISPWNYPFTLSMTPLVTALFAGNAVVLKPSEVTPTVGLAIGELFEHPVWGDLVQVVTGTGATGEALVRSGVDKVAFTGSVPTGRRVMATAAESLTPVLLELGGKDPMIVCDDADLERAARGAVWGAFQNAGQTCMSVERVYVTEAVAEEFIDRVIVHTGEIRQGDGGADGSGDIGSMTAASQIPIVESHLRDAVERGARVVVGGERVDRPGLWFPPTVLTGVDHSMLIMTEETFGPVLPIMVVADVDEAVRLANDSRYGLNASVWSGDDDLAVDVANRLESGNVCINDCIVSYGVPGLPFGGVKDSGIGRVHGIEGLHEFSRTKSILASRVTPSREPWWYPTPDGLDRAALATLRLRMRSGLMAKLRGLKPRR